MKKIILIIIVITVFGCNDDGEESTSATSVNLIDKYYFKNMMYPVSTLSDANSDNLVKLVYDSNKRIIKRNGGYREIDQSTGYTHAYDETIYDEITYSGNQIFIQRKSSSNIFTPTKYEATIFFDNELKYTKKIVQDLSTFPQTYTLFYFFDSDKNLIKTQKTYSNIIETSNYFFDNKKNIVKIETVKLQNEIQLSRTTELFSDYDSSENPIKGLAMFDELFYRCLSKNNFKKYERNEYNAANELIASSYRTWNFVYDSYGRVMFDQF